MALGAKEVRDALRVRCALGAQLEDEMQRGAPAGREEVVAPRRNEHRQEPAMFNAAWEGWQLRNVMRCPSAAKARDNEHRRSARVLIQEAVPLAAAVVDEACGGTNKAVAADECG